MSKYRVKISREQLRKSHDKKGGANYNVLSLPDGAKTFRPTEKKAIKIDIIPFFPTKHNLYFEGEVGEDLYYESTFFVHKLQDRTVVCPKKTRKQRCPICEYMATLSWDIPAEKTILSSISARERQLFNVIDLEADKNEILIWDVSYHLFGNYLISAIVDGEEDDNLEEFCDIKTGKTLRIIPKECTFGKVKFLEYPSITFRDRKTKYGKDIIDSAYCLDDLLKIESYEKITEYMSADMGEVSDNDDDDDDEEEVVSKKKKSKDKDVKRKKDAKKKKREDDDDLDIDDDDDIEF